MSLRPDAAATAPNKFRERGFALLIVLWAIVLLALLVTHLTVTGRNEAQLAGNLRTAAVLEAAANGAVSDAIFHVLDSSASHWPADGLVHRIQSPGAVVDVSIGSEAGKLNINTAQPELLQALLHVIGVDTGTAASLATAIADWRFPDAQNRSGIPKVQQYQDAGRDYAPPGEAFQSMEELGLVLGTTPAIQARLLPYVSIYHDGDPDTRDAARPVIQAIREATGAYPPPTTGPPDERVVVITATALSPDAGIGRFVRRSVVKVGARGQGALFQILTWTTVPG